MTLVHSQFVMLEPWIDQIKKFVVPQIVFDPIFLFNTKSSVEPKKITKIILDLKFFWTQNSLGTKVLLVTKLFWTQICFGHKFFWDPIFFLPNFFGPKCFYGNFFLTKIFFLTQTFLTQNSFLTELFDPEVFRIQKFLDTALTHTPHKGRCWARVPQL